MTCDICGRYPHDRRCPRCEETACGECENCGMEIIYGDEFYIDGNGAKFCSSECAMNYHGIKQTVQYEDEDKGGFI